MKDLIIVESPNKIKTIQSYVGDNYKIIATYGHLRELNKKKGFTQDFDPIWQVIDTNSKETKKEIIQNIRKSAKESKRIFLATDPDREGEAISWHVYDLLDKSDQEKCKRITFNEVTKKAILSAIENQHDIDINLVHSQFTRRILDRIIGYKLSTFVKYSLNAISAGRVQSIALLFVVERELERRAFVPSSWYEITASIDDDVILNFVDTKKQFKQYSDTSNIPFRFEKKEEAEFVCKNLGDKFELKTISEPRITTSEVQKPFTTDKLLQAASSQLGWGTSKTTLIAQKMFEGVEYNSEVIGLISYPRTDSNRLNDDFVNETRNFIVKNFGEQYFSLNNINKQNQKKDANVQDAHEAIRPVNIFLTPEFLSNDKSVPKDILKLYNIIWTKTVASLMKVPEYQNTTFTFDNNNYDFVISKKTLLFDGYLILDFYKKQKEELIKKFPDWKIGDIITSKDIQLSEHEKQPPQYYTEATLIAALKDSGVGRPSTYSTMARIGESRGYINKESQKLIPNELGMDLIELLTKNFPNVIDKKFTANTEIDLDKIASGDLFWKIPLENFDEIFKKEVNDAYSKTQKIQPEILDEKCPECNNSLAKKSSKYGVKFIACLGFPKCKYTRSLEETQYVGRECPQCSKQLVYKLNKKRQRFIGCSGYPECHYIESINTKKTRKKESSEI